MGIRIHKVMGYGLTDIKLHNGKVIDERFNQYMVGWDVIDRSLTRFTNFIQDPGLVKILARQFSLVSNMKTLNYMIEDYSAQGYAHKSLKNIDHCVDFHYKTLIFMPPESVKEWYRYDNPIDYYECTGHKSFRSNVRQLGISGLYPSYGYRPKPWKQSKIPCFNELSESEYQVFLRDPRYSKHIEEDWCVNIPVVIRLMAAYLGLFKRPETIFELKPMIHTYWS
jgi:hypothetical protein